MNKVNCLLVIFILITFSIKAECINTNDGKRVIVLYNYDEAGNMISRTYKYVNTIDGEYQIIDGGLLIDDSPSIDVGDLLVGANGNNNGGANFPGHIRPGSIMPGDSISSYDGKTDFIRDDKQAVIDQKMNIP